MTNPTTYLQAAQDWAQDPSIDKDSRQEIQDLITAQNQKEITDRFYRELEFGTGGLRGIIGAGSARMNIYNVRKATLAFAQTLLQHAPKECEKQIAISYDSRRYSRLFAHTVAEVMAGQGIKALVTKELRPVPMLSFMVRHFHCLGGVCITASHNPPNYNGYKVYWHTGGQIIPPFDDFVIKNYSQIKSYSGIPFTAYDEGVRTGMIEEVSSDFDKIYFDRVQGLSLNKEGRAGFKIVFTPLHGTAGYPLKEVLTRFGFSGVHAVKEQELPDENFPTVEFPNPEDPRALTMAVQLGKELAADLILATDPDCDRIGIVYKDQKGCYQFLNGNQIGCLLMEYVLSEKSRQQTLPDNPMVIKTIVTTDLQNEIARHYKVSCEETLTGFKWICKLIEEYESGQRTPYKKFVCGGEESYGFLMDTFVRDKDGLIACAIAAEMTATYKSRGLTLDEVLDQIYLRHGVYQENLVTLTLPGKDGADKIAQMMQHLREHPPQEIAGVSIVKINDILTGDEITLGPRSQKELRKLDLPASNVLQMFLADGTKVSARPSGTEPKIKFYTSVKRELGKNANKGALEEAKAYCSQRIHEIEQTFMQIIKKI